MDVGQHVDEPLAVAARFLAALDSRDWDTAASFVATDTIHELQRWIVWFLRHERVETPERASDTRFPAIRESLNIGSAHEAERMRPVSLLANFMAGTSQQIEIAVRGSGFDADSAGQRRVQRTIQSSAPARAAGAPRLFVMYTVANSTLAAPQKSQTHRLEMVHTSEGWRVWNADITGTGNGTLRPPLPAEVAFPGSPPSDRR
jgi:hypothetical protein